jgi:hypothetical protein
MVPAEVYVCLRGPRKEGARGRGDAAGMMEKTEVLGPELNCDYGPDGPVWHE